MGGVLANRCAAQDEGKKNDKDTAVVDDNSDAQVDEPQAQTNDDTENLKETEQPVKELTNEAADSEEDEETKPQPHGPLSELSVDQVDDARDDEIDVDPLPEESIEEVEVVKASAEAAAPAETEQVTEKPQEDDSLSNLFSDEEEEENPLANLINSLPDVTTQELLDDLQEIKEIIREWQRK